MTSRQRAEQAEAERDVTRFIAVEAIRLMTPDQRERLRDRLVCLQLDEGEL